MDDGRQRGRGLGKKRELVDDDGHGAARGDAHQLADGFVPVSETEWHWFVTVTGEGLAELPERVGLSGLGGGEHEAAAGAGDCIEQEGLALAAPPGDDAQGGFRAWVPGEASQLGPFEVTVEHVGWLVHCPVPAIDSSSYYNCNYTTPGSLPAVVSRLR